MTVLPRDIGPAEFDRLHDEQPALWRPVLEAIVAAHSSLPLRLPAEGTALVGLVGDALVVKLYPPFLRDHHDFEHALLQRLQDVALAVPTPRLVASGERDGWPWLLMTQLAGTPLIERWPAMDEAARCRALRQIGALAAQVHALPVGGMAALAAPWPAFLAAQRVGCTRRQTRTGLPAHLLAQLDAFLDGPLPQGPDVILTGEYTPMNLLHDDARGVCAMFDFGDGLVGPREYDWLGPLCFLAAGSAARCAAYFEGYGAQPTAAEREGLLRLLLLHRYSHLPAQLALPGWQALPDFQTLAARLWP